MRAPELDVASRGHGEGENVGAAPAWQRRRHGGAKGRGTTGGGGASDEPWCRVGTVAWPGEDGAGAGGSRAGRPEQRSGRRGGRSPMESRA